MTPLGGSKSEASRQAVGGTTGSPGASQPVRNPIAVSVDAVVAAGPDICAVVRDLRNTPATVWAALEEHDLVLTSNGAPVAVVLRIEDDLEQTLALVRRARAQQAVSQLRERAAQHATALTEAEIDAEIGAVRRDRQRARGSCSTRTC